jgi:hypothetical protein
MNLPSDSVRPTDSIAPRGEPELVSTGAGGSHQGVPASGQPQIGRLQSFVTKHPSIGVVLRFAPLAAGLAVGKALLDYLPDSLSGDAARYSVALLGAITTVSSLAWLRLRLSGTDKAPAGDAHKDITSSTSNKSVQQILDLSEHALLNWILEVDDGQGHRLVGWPHFLDESQRLSQRPTAIGTTYGLKAMMTLRSMDSRFRRAEIIETLWNLQVSPSGGWASTSQSTVGRPEVTAWVLAALKRAGADDKQVANSITLLEAMMASDADPVVWRKTHIVATVLSSLTYIAPGSPLIGRLRQTLLDGMGRDSEHDGLVYWGEDLSPRSNEEPPRSTPHTARAIVALSRTVRIDPSDRAVQIAIDQGRKWLLSHHELSNQTEQIIRIQSDQHKEVLVVRHFTAAWMARALMSQGERGNGDLLTDVIRKVSDLNQGGLWAWDNDEHPIWMTYQAITALQDYALNHCEVVAR